MAEKKLGWGERLKAKAAQKAAQVAEAAKKAGGAIKDTTESGVGVKLKEGFDDAVEGGKKMAGNAINKVKAVDWKEVGGKMKGFADGASDWTKDSITKLDGAIKSEEFQGFLDSAGDKLEGAKPLGGAIKDSLGDMVDDPEAMKKILGGALLTGGANIPYAIAQEVMSDPQVQGVFSELVDDALPEGMEGNVDAILALSNSELAEFFKNPSMTSVLQAALQRPEIKKMLKDKASEFTQSKPEIDPNAPAANDSVIPESTPATLSQ